jgi:hypothetical protein
MEKDFTNGGIFWNERNECFEWKNEFFQPTEQSYAWEILIIFCAEEFNNFGENARGVNYYNHINIEKRKRKKKWKNDGFKLMVAKWERQ